MVVTDSFPHTTSLALKGSASHPLAKILPVLFIVRLHNSVTQLSPFRLEHRRHRRGLTANAYGITRASNDRIPCVLLLPCRWTPRGESFAALARSSRVA